MPIPIRDPISGAPAGAAPLIRSWVSRRKSFAARCLLALPAGSPAPDGPSLWEAGRVIHWDGRWDLLASPVRVDLYRSARPATENREPGVLAAWPLPWEPEPVTADELAEAERRTPELRPDELVDHARLLRGEPVDPESGRLARSPWRMSRHEAEEAAIAYVTTAELYRGVREEHGRWQGYVGLGGMLRVVCTCDTREEALTVATAAVWRAWLTRVEEIRRLRGDDLSWGWAIPSPVLWDEDPQARY